MVTQALVEPKIDAGRRLLRQLDSEGELPVPAALWIFIEASDWRLLIASPVVDTEGPKEGYRRIQRILESGNIPLDLRDITLVSPSEHLIQLLQIAIDTGPGIAGIRFSRNTISGFFIEDAYIYRVDVRSLRSSTKQRKVAKGKA